MTRCLPALALAAALLTGCDALDPNDAANATPPQPLPTVDAEGALSIPAGYQPGPKIDTTRVDCGQYLAMTPVDIREEARRLCTSSTTPAERERNPYCGIDAVTTACLARTPGAR
jgi:hypothetical protein